VGFPAIAASVDNMHVATLSAKTFFPTDYSTLRSY
jgi:hypothetical protein